MHFEFKILHVQIYSCFFVKSSVHQGSDTMCNLCVSDARDCFCVTIYRIWSPPCHFLSTQWQKIHNNALYSLRDNHHCVFTDWVVLNSKLGVGGWVHAQAQTMTNSLWLKEVDGSVHIVLATCCTTQDMNVACDNSMNAELQRCVCCVWVGPAWLVWHRD